MEKGNTRQGILEAALELFSVQGFEASPIAQIASAVGIRKASLYSHYESNKDVSRNKNTSEKNSDFFFKPQPICVCFISKG